jgi:hypothetical protein
MKSTPKLWDAVHLTSIQPASQFDFQKFSHFRFSEFIPNLFSQWMLGISFYILWGPATLGGNRGT